MPERMNGERLCYLASMARWTEVKEMALDLLDARRERDEAIEAIKLLVERAAHIIGTHPTWTNENTNTGVVEAALGYLEQLMRETARAAAKEGGNE